jgi:hypothetical protein
MPWLAALLAHCAASILTCPPESKVFYYPLGTQDRADQVIVQGSNLLLLLTATPPPPPGTSQATSPIYQQHMRIAHGLKQSWKGSKQHSVPWHGVHCASITHAGTVKWQMQNKFCLDLGHPIGNCPSLPTLSRSQVS